MKKSQIEISLIERMNQKTKAGELYENFKRM